MKTIKGIECQKCGDRLYSRSRHDFRACKCGECFIDGGRDYMRIGGHPKIVDIEIQEPSDG